MDLYTNKAISLITWMEVMVGATLETEATLRGFLNNVVNLPIDAPVANLAVSLRRQHKIKLSDAIVWASAQAYACITGDAQ